MVKLSKAQGQALLYYHLVGDNVGKFPFSTFKALEKKGMINLCHDITLTEKGRLWCDENHMNVPPIKKG